MHNHVNLFADFFIHGFLVFERTVKDDLAILFIPGTRDFHAIDVVASEMLSIGTVVVDTITVFLIVLIRRKGNIHVYSHVIAIADLTHFPASHVTVTIGPNIVTVASSSMVDDRAHVTTTMIIILVVVDPIAHAIASVSDIVAEIGVAIGIEAHA